MNIITIINSEYNYTRCNRTVKYSNRQINFEIFSTFILIQIACKNKVRF